MTLLLIFLSVFLPIATPVILGWMFRWGTRRVCSSCLLNGGGIVRFAFGLCWLGVVVTLAFWLSRWFTGMASLLGGFFFYGPGLFLYALYGGASEETSDIPSYGLNASTDETISTDSGKTNGNGLPVAESALPRGEK